MTATLSLIRLQIQKVSARHRQPFKARGFVQLHITIQAIAKMRLGNEPLKIGIHVGTRKLIIKSIVASVRRQLLIKLRLKTHYAVRLISLWLGLRMLMNLLLIIVIKLSLRTISRPKCLAWCIVLAHITLLAWSCGAKLRIILVILPRKQHAHVGSTVKRWTHI